MITKKCRDCGKEFTLTDGEIEFYRSKGFELPTRCKSCRDKRKGSKPSPSAQSHKRNKKHKSSRSGSPILVVILAAILLGALVLKFSDVPDPVQNMFSEMSETTVNITTEAPADIYSDIISETNYVTTTSEAIVTSPDTASTTAANITTTAEHETQGFCFRNEKLLEEHYEKHGIEMGFSSPQEYERAAAAVVSSPGVLHKLEKEDNDDVYYLESTNEFVIVSTDGYIRTYYKPNDGKDYFDRQ